MSFFPFFIDIKGMKILIVGGGKIALRKIDALLPYEPQITVVAPSVCDEIMRIKGITVYISPFHEDLLSNQGAVVAATNNPLKNRQISALCKERGILINSVDDISGCSFIFPCLIKRGNLSIGISTGGASPSAAKYLKQQINAVIPDHFDEILSYLSSVRNRYKTAIEAEEIRSVFYSRVFTLCMEKNRCLLPSEENQVFKEVTNDQ